MERKKHLGANCLGAEKRPFHKNSEYPMGVTIYQNGPKRTYENTETDFCGYRNGPERTSVGTETDRKRLQLIPKRTSMGTRKGRMGYDRNDPNKIMYVLVGRVKR